MPFVRLPGVEGKVYVPEADSKGRKKHPCKDCHSCQMCSDDRCAVCRGQVGPSEKTKKCECGREKASEE